MNQVKSNRLVSLDVFRGATIAAMILVNNPGSWSNVYGPLLHAENSRRRKQTHAHTWNAPKGWAGPGL